MSAADLYGPCKGCGVNVDPWAHDCPQADCAASARAARRVYGMCTACGAVEVALSRVGGSRDLSAVGESASYPTGYGCEVCD